MPADLFDVGEDRQMRRRRGVGVQRAARLLPVGIDIDGGHPGAAGLGQHHGEFHGAHRPGVAGDGDEEAQPGVGRTPSFAARRNDCRGLAEGGQQRFDPRLESTFLGDQRLDAEIQQVVALVGLSR